MPSIYASTGATVQHAPTDPLYDHIDNDGMPEIAIGHLPVQSEAELKILIIKILTYDVVSTRKNAVFVSDGVDDGTRRSFTDVSLAVRRRLSNWDVGTLAADRVKPEGLRRRLTDHVNDGMSLLVYFGHSDTNDWGFDGLI